MPEPTEPDRAGRETIDEARRTSFDHRAELYDAVRPSYPVALVEDVLARCSPRRMLEIGAGTGKATVLFARAGRELVAIEPGANLAAVLRRNVAGLAHVTVEETTFEAYTGGGFDLVYAAQALHWIDPAMRYAKAAQLLRPGGALAAIRNETQAAEPELQQELDAAYARWFPEGPRRNELAEVERWWVDEIDASGRFGPVHVGRFPWSARMTTRGYLDLLDTYSDHALLPDAQRGALYAQLADAIERHGGRFELPYTALVCLACVRPRA
ncbi:MAG TPA: class I SAM-dependent methyltransferase [Kofleriaceae bacterium]|nr:class I SAM-dependent methyltransferase [Kofleriaceae bacterium]